MEYYVYGLIDPRTGEPFYIGKGKGRRATAHLREIGPLRDNPFKANVIAKIRENGQEPTIVKLELKLTEEEAFIAEIKWIKHYGRRDLGTGCLTNLSNGGEGQTGHRHTDETKRKISEGQIGERNPFFGRKHTEESRDKIWGNRKTRTVSLEQRAKLSVAFKGRFVSEETRRRMSEAHRGRIKTPEHIEKIASKKRGVPISDLHKAKISLGLKKHHASTTA